MIKPRIFMMMMMMIIVFCTLTVYAQMDAEKIPTDNTGNYDSQDFLRAFNDMPVASKDKIISILRESAHRYDQLDQDNDNDIKRYLSPNFTKDEKAPMIVVAAVELEKAARWELAETLDEIRNGTLGPEMLEKEKDVVNNIVLQQENFDEYRKQARNYFHQASQGKAASKLISSTNASIIGASNSTTDPTEEEQDKTWGTSIKRFFRRIWYSLKRRFWKLTNQFKLMFRAATDEFVEVMGNSLDLETMGHLILIMLMFWMKDGSFVSALTHGAGKLATEKLLSGFNTNIPKFHECIASGKYERLEECLPLLNMKGVMEILKRAAINIHRRMSSYEQQNISNHYKSLSYKTRIVAPLQLPVTVPVTVPAPVPAPVTVTV